MDLRSQARERLASEQFDVLVIGGGIVGAGIAEAAARQGLAVALVDRADFGGATSSASSKLIHGGLRYLRMGDIGLVREAHQERRVLMEIAPHLVRRIPFLFPLYRGGPYRPATVQAGIWLYSTLARERLGGFVRPARAVRSVPDLHVEGLRGCGVYSDAWTHDSRLCLANVRGAADAGAAVLNYAAVESLRVERGRVVGAEVAGVGPVRARAVVNATGAWVDHVRRMEDPGAAPSVRLSKGVHAVVDLERPWSAALTIPRDAVRVTFAVPWEGMLLLGTTDTLYDGDPAAVAVTERDVAQILAEAETAVDGLRGAQVRASFAGLRVLPGGGDDTASARRETVYSTGPAGMLTVAGGKLTTYRRIALGALEALRPQLGLHRVDRLPHPLPGAALDAPSPALSELDAPVRAHLLHLYGGLANEVLADVEGEPDQLRALHPRAPEIAAQVAYAYRREWAVTTEDVLRRRTTLALRGIDADELDMGRSTGAAQAL
ncbi:MAG TPA: glycerol-3-phosphate dehydrogenase/oxidase [Gaiellaceae bacterium]